ncbi:hypothetical protein D9758_018378 [Tetrapyrgos nigripes]|uniref:Uncharacterized protein n=1 Tax=Tetrapyrgos nigripes TaxID=182062 RepID=A0A8H5BCN5_9AGAR|nr:hypothetical protein D9758_018378 [Tetrapyrgos nigripes]
MPRKVAKIPIVTGPKTGYRIRIYIKTEFLSTISNKDLGTLLQAYPEDPVLRFSI